MTGESHLDDGAHLFVVETAVLAGASITAVTYRSGDDRRVSNTPSLTPTTRIDLDFYSFWRLPHVHASIVPGVATVLRTAHPAPHPAIAPASLHEVGAGKRTANGHLAPATRLTTPPDKTLALL